MSKNSKNIPSKLKRGTKIILKNASKNGDKHLYDLYDAYTGKKMLDAKDNYFISIKDVCYYGGIINGDFLGFVDYDISTKNDKRLKIKNGFLYLDNHYNSATKTKLMYVKNMKEVIILID